MRHDPVRELGDDQCEFCPVYDARLGQRIPGSLLDADGRQAVELASRCQKFRVLPKAGGIADQEPGEVDLIEAITGSPWWAELHASPEASQTAANAPRSEA